MEFQNICNEMVAPFLLRHPVFLPASTDTKIIRTEQVTPEL